MSNYKKMQKKIDFSGRSKEGDPLTLFART